MDLGPLLRPRTGLLALVLCLAACSTPGNDEGGEDLGAVELRASGTKLVASSWVKLWSDLPKDRSGLAHYRACLGEPFKYTLAFRNKGDAIWRDEPGRGKEPGSDVFLETANGKKDTLAGKKRFSLRWNSNDWVRGDRKARECTVDRGCRRTRSVHDGISATAPAKPGVYKSRWRLRDYSRAWDKPRGFGPKVELRVRVQWCPEAGECACNVTCSDGTKSVLWLNEGDDYQCKNSADYACWPAAATQHQFVPCVAPLDGGAGSGGSSGAVNADEPPDGPGYWITDSDDVVGVGGSGGTGGSGGSGSVEWWADGDDPGVGDDVSDDPDYEPDGFDGVAEEFEPGVVSADDSGCALSPRPSAPLALVCLTAAGALLLRKRRSKGKL